MSRCDGGVSRYRDLQGQLQSALLGVNGYGLEGYTLTEGQAGNKKSLIVEVHLRLMLFREVTDL